MATEGNGGLGSNEEVREGQQMDRLRMHVADCRMEDVMQSLLALLEPQIHRPVCEAFAHLMNSGLAMVGGRFCGSLQSNRMATEGNGGLGSSEEVRQGQLMDPALERLGEYLMDDSIQNPWSSLEPYIRRLVRQAFEDLMKSVPASVDAFLMEDSTHNTTPWLESYIRGLVRQAFEDLMKPGPASVDAFLMEDSTQNTTPWLESYICRLVRQAFGDLMKTGLAMVGGSSVNRREQIQEPYRRIWQLRFQTSLPDHFFVGKKVEGRDGAICVKLFDATTDHVVVSGPLSSLKPVVVVLAGDFNNKDDDDWTWEDFKRNLETGRQGKGRLLEGDLQVPLKEGEGSLAEFKFTDISTCRRSGKFRLGVIVEAGLFNYISVREAITAAFEVKHYKKKCEEKHVMRSLDDDVGTLKGIGKDLRDNLNKVRIFKVKDFLWKLAFDWEGLRKILGRSMSNKKWDTLANKSVPRGKRHVYYADNMKNSGVVFKNMSELCGLIEGGKYHSAETLSDRQKVSADDLKKEACAKWEKIVQYDGLQLLEMNPSERACSSQTDIVIGAPDSCRYGIDLASSSCVGSPVNSGLYIGGGYYGKGKGKVQLGGEENRGKGKGKVQLGGEENRGKGKGKVQLNSFQIADEEYIADNLYLESRGFYKKKRNFR